MLAGGKVAPTGTSGEAATLTGRHPPAKRGGGPHKDAALRAKSRVAPNFAAWPVAASRVASALVSDPAPEPAPSTPTEEAATRAYHPGTAEQAGKVADAAHKGLATARRTVRSNPWVALGGALAAGAAIGFFVKR